MFILQSCLLLWFSWRLTDQTQNMHAFYWTSVSLTLFLITQTPPQWHSGKVSSLWTGNPGVDSRFPRWSYTNDWTTGILEANMPNTWRHRVSTKTAWPSVSIQWVGEMANLIGNFYLSVAAHYSLSRSALPWAIHFACYWDNKQSRNNNDHRVMLHLSSRYNVILSVSFAASGLFY